MTTTKTRRKIFEEYVEKEDELLDGDKWIATIEYVENVRRKLREYGNEKVLLVCDVQKEIDVIIAFRDNERKNNNIWRFSEDELNDQFIENLRHLKKVLGLLEEEKYTTEEENKVKALTTRSESVSSSSPKKILNGDETMVKCVYCGKKSKSDVCEKCKKTNARD